MRSAYGAGPFDEALTRALNADSLTAAEPDRLFEGRERKLRASASGLQGQSVDARPVRRSWVLGPCAGTPVSSREPG